MQATQFGGFLPKWNSKSFFKKVFQPVDRANLSSTIE